jgi:transposase
VAHTLISRFVDHLPYSRQEPINARSGVHTPRSTLASWGVAGGASLEPLYELHRAFVLGCRMLHADEMPVPLLDPGTGKTKNLARCSSSRIRGSEACLIPAFAHTSG